MLPLLEELNRKERGLQVYHFLEPHLPTLAVPLSNQRTATTGSKQTFPKNWPNPRPLPIQMTHGLLKRLPTHAIAEHKHLFCISLLISPDQMTWTRPSQPHHSWPTPPTRSPCPRNKETTSDIGKKLVAQPDLLMDFFHLNSSELPKTRLICM